MVEIILRGVEGDYYDKKSFVIGKIKGTLTAKSGGGFIFTIADLKVSAKLKGALK